MWNRLFLLANRLILLIGKDLPRSVLQLAEPVGIDGHIGLYFVVAPGVDEHKVSINRGELLLGGLYTDGVFLGYLIHARQAVDVAETPFVDLCCLDDFALFHLFGNGSCTLLNFGYSLNHVEFSSSLGTSRRLGSISPLGVSYHRSPHFMPSLGTGSGSIKPPPKSMWVAPPLNLASCSISVEDFGEDAIYLLAEHTAVALGAETAVAFVAHNTTPVIGAD